MLSIIKSVSSSVVSVASKIPQLPLGLILGYVGHPIIKLAIDAVAVIVKKLLG